MLDFVPNVKDGTAYEFDNPPDVVKSTDGAPYLSDGVVKASPNSDMGPNEDTPCCWPDPYAFINDPTLGTPLADDILKDDTPYVVDGIPEGTLYVDDSVPVAVGWLYLVENILIGKLL